VALKQLDILLKNNEAGTLPHAIYKYHLKWTKDLNVSWFQASHGKKYLDPISTNKSGIVVLAMWEM
jgi:hypothetical protein